MKMVIFQLWDLYHIYQLALRILLARAHPHSSIYLLSIICLSVSLAWTYEFQFLMAYGFYGLNVCVPQISSVEILTPKSLRR